MPDLDFEVVGAETPAFAAVPLLVFKLHVANTDEQEHIHNVLLRCQIQINVTRRRYSPAEQARLLDVFGEPKRWRETLRPLLWTHASAVVPPFTGSIIVDLPIACTYDFEVVGTKYFAALNDGEIPLTFLFSGTIFYEGEAGNLQVRQISWSKEASYRLPVAVWQEVIARYYPNTSWIRLHRDIFDQLYRYKAEHGFPTWEQTFEHLLKMGVQRAKPPDGGAGVSPDFSPFSTKVSPGYAREADEETRS